jgi:hypothetical protein
MEKTWCSILNATVTFPNPTPCFGRGNTFAARNARGFI